MVIDPNFKQLLITLATEIMPSFQGRQLSNFMWSISKLGWQQLGSSLQAFLLKADARACICLQEGLFTQPSELSILFWSFARLGHRPVSLLQVLSTADGGFLLSRHLREFGPQEVSNFSWACAKLQIQRPDIICPLASRASELVALSDPRDLSVTLWSFGRIGQTSGEVQQLFKAVAEKGPEAMRECTGRDLANICWACAKLKLNTGGILDLALDVSCTRLHEFNAHSISNIMWAMGQMDCLTPTRLEAVTQALGEHAHSFTPQGLANALSALAMSSAAADTQTTFHSAIDTIALAAIALGPELDHQNISNILWALGTIRHRSLAVDQLVDVIIGECCKKAKGFTPQGLSNTLWGLARLQEIPGKEDAGVRELLDAFLPCVVSTASSFKAQDISHTVWAYARLRRYDARLLASMEKQAAETIEDFTAQGMSNVIWGYASLGVYSSPLMDAVANRAPRMMHEFSGQGLANLVWGYAKLDYVKPEPLLDAVAREAAPRLGDLSAMTISSLVESFSEMNYPSLPLFDAVDDVVIERLEEFKGPLAEKLVSSFSDAGYHSRAAIPLLAQAAEAAIQSLAYQTQGFKGSSRWSQTQRRHYTALMVEVFCSGGLPNLPGKLHERAIPRLIK